MKQTAVSLPSFHTHGVIEAGCDEAGRGCLAGPVYAAAVILPPDFTHPLLNDSKKLTEKQREALRPVIEENALAWGVGIVTAEEIDNINILRASILAMHRALEALTIQPQHIIVDGNRFTSYKDIPFTTIVKGDAKFASIAAASILAKTHRDSAMMHLAEQYPQYGWEINKGYPTAAHRAAIAAHGPSPLH
ncbi:MAG: ribonuclease HII, partial [Paramuribaculum sp.]|nr:ribonuclease HII [Paramuribaculum sp.]